VTISGEIDLYTAPRLHSELGAVLADGMPTRVVITCPAWVHDSTGMNLSCLRRVRERAASGRLPQAAVPDPQVTGLDSVFAWS
jgi:anti-sigma B factor antagonist